MKAALGQKPKWAKPRGPKFLRDVINQLFEELGRVGALEGLGITVEQTPSGRVISTLNSPAGRAAPSAATAGTATPFAMLLVEQEPPVEGAYAVEITDGKVNNEWPDVGINAMGETGSRKLNIGNVENSNIFLRIMFNTRTNAQERIDIFERPNETYPLNKITYLADDIEPTPGACNAVDGPDDPPPAGYGSIHVLLGFTYVNEESGQPIVFNLVIGNINYALIYGESDGVPSVIPVATYSDWTQFPQAPP